MTTWELEPRSLEDGGGWEYDSDLVSFDDIPMDGELEDYNELSEIKYNGLGSTPVWTNESKS